MVYSNVNLCLLCISSISSFLFLLMPYYLWISLIVTYRRLKRIGFPGPAPSFPFGNLGEMKKKNIKVKAKSKTSNEISHDIHATAVPFYARWQRDHGKVFIYWLGTEPFLYVADPEFLRKMSSDVLGKNWGKPTVFKKDRDSMFGRGLNMVEGEEWVLQRHIITPAFSPANIKGMSRLMAGVTTKSMERWDALISSGNNEIDVEAEIIKLSREIIARTAFGLTYEQGRKVLDKLKALQVTLYSSQFVGVPFGQLMTPKRIIMSKRLGKEIDDLILDIIMERKRKMINDGEVQTDLLGLLLADGKGKNAFSAKSLVDECKMFFFGGHETTAIALSWTLLCLALNPRWQDELRDEINKVIGQNEINYTMLGGLKKMNLVMHEVLRLYSSSPNIQRQTRQNMVVDGHTIPKDTNIWIDLISMHHDPELLGDDVFEFKPERFINDPLYGGCKHKMGYVPFGFGGRMCIGRNLTIMEYNIVLAIILSRFSLAVSAGYRHQPTTLLSLRPAYGIPVIVTRLNQN
ncbi:unnamed protein product [Rhodiola kirilowii]